MLIVTDGRNTKHKNELRSIDLKALPTLISVKENGDDSFKFFKSAHVHILAFHSKFLPTI